MASGGSPMVQPRVITQPAALGQKAKLEIHVQHMNDFPVLAHIEVRRADGSVTVIDTNVRISKTGWTRPQTLVLFDDAGQLGQMAIPVTLRDQSTGNVIGTSEATANIELNGPTEPPFPPFNP